MEAALLPRKVMGQRHLKGEDKMYVFDGLDIGNAGMVMSGDRSRAGFATSGELLLA